MNLEIERKFLVVPEKLPPLGEGEAIRQGYLATNPVVRIRLAPKGAKLTIKGPGSLARQEFEWPVAPGDAEALFSLSKASVEKTRFRLGRWEIDRFAGALDGLWLAECELSREDEPLPPAGPWLGREVTGEPGYSNASLATYGLPVARATSG